MKVHNIYKALGQTPLQALESFRKKKKISPFARLTYAGRLDPMAEGVLLVLEGVTQIQKEKYLSLTKVYQAQVLFGLSTDTFDVLGLAKKHKTTLQDKNSFASMLDRLVGNINLALPPYSSVPIKGKPLFVWARQGRLSEIDIPKRNMKIFNIDYHGFRMVGSKAILKKVTGKIKKVDGDFRQDKILKQWSRILLKAERYCLISFSVKCGSGTYIRSLADHIGKEFNTSAMLFDLKRLNVGKYTIKK